MTMQTERKLYDANLRLLEVELEMADFPDEVTWDLRQEMPWKQREQFTVAFETNVFGGQLKGVLYFQLNPGNEVYRFDAFEVELGKKVEGRVRSCRFERGLGYSVGLREAVNLMQGRPVHRYYRNDPSGSGYGYWLELRELGEDRYEVAPGIMVKEPFYMLETGLFTKRLGIEACRRIAEQLQRGDRVRVEVNGKVVFVEVDAKKEQLLLTNGAGRPARLNWWEVFIGRK
jgi:hypothetical protein